MGTSIVDADRGRCQCCYPASVSLGEKVSVANPVRLAATRRARLKGLLGQHGRQGEGKNCEVLMLAPCRDIHTFGMRQPIDIAFVNADGVVVSVQRGLIPGSRLRSRKAAVVLERLACSDPWYEPGQRLMITVI